MQTTSTDKTISEYKIQILDTYHFLRLFLKLINQNTKTFGFDNLTNAIKYSMILLKYSFNGLMNIPFHFLFYCLLTQYINIFNYNKLTIWFQCKVHYLSTKTTADQFHQTLAIYNINCIPLSCAKITMSKSNICSAFK